MALAFVAIALVFGSAGCPPREAPPVIRFDPVPLREAAGVVNDNNGTIGGTLQARRGFARGYFADADGKQRQFSYDANLLFFPPRHLRLDLKTLGRSHVQFGSNDARYWVAVKPQIDTLWWGRHDARPVHRTSQLIIRPDLMVDALGLSSVPTGDQEGLTVMQRITPDFQQVLVTETYAGSRPYLSREYWLKRYDRRLVDRIIFRDALGQVAMISRLSDYKRIGDDGPILPHRIELDWPAGDSRMTLTAAGWRIRRDVDADFRGFVDPVERGETFDRIVDIDTELDNRDVPILPPALLGTPQLSPEG